jgi:hypothetical protein
LKSLESLNKIHSSFGSFLTEITFKVEILCSQTYCVQVWNLEGQLLSKYDESDVLRSFDFFVEIYVEFLEHFSLVSLHGSFVTADHL